LAWGTAGPTIVAILGVRAGKNTRQDTLEPIIRVRDITSMPSERNASIDGLDELGVSTLRVGVAALAVVKDKV